MSIEEDRKKLERWVLVIKELYNGLESQGNFEKLDDAAKLREIANWLDRVDNETDKALDGRSQTQRKLQITIRAIARKLDKLDKCNQSENYHTMPHRGCIMR